MILLLYLSLYVDDTTIILSKIVTSKNVMETGNTKTVKLIYIIYNGEMAQSVEYQPRN